MVSGIVTANDVVGRMGIASHRFSDGLSGGRSSRGVSIRPTISLSIRGLIGRAGPGFGSGMR